MRTRFQHNCRAIAEGTSFEAATWLLSGLFLLNILAMEVVGQEAPPTERGAPSKFTERLTQSDSGSAEEAERQAAIREIPIAELHPAAQAAVRNSVSHATAYRRLPVRLIPCTPRLYGLMSNHPDLVVSMWRSLGMTELNLQEVDGGVYDLSDAAGTSGRIRYLYRSREKLLILVDGQYSGPLSVTTLKGRSLILLTSKYYLGSDGKPYVRCQADCFIKIENEGAEMIVRLLEPIVSGVVDNNFIHTASFVGDVYESSVQDPRSVIALAQDMDAVRPEVIQEFISAAQEVLTESVSLQMSGTPHAATNSESAAQPEPVPHTPAEMTLPAPPSNTQAFPPSYDPGLLRRRTVEREGPEPHAMPDPGWR